MANKKNDLPRQNIVIEPVAALFDPEVDPIDERLHRDRQKRLWQRIEDAKQPPPRPPAHELDANGLPLLSIGISATGIDNEFNFRRVERKRDFEDSVFHMLSELNYALRYNKTLSTDQRDHLKRTRDAFEKSIGQLEKRVHASGPEDGLDLIGAAIAAAYEIGAFGGRHPIERKLRTTRGRGVISAKVLRRREIITPLVLAEAKHKRKGIPERAFVKAKKLLIAKGLVKKGKKGKDGFSPRTFAKDVSQILAENPE